MGEQLCACGCGRPAPIAKKTDKSNGRVRGQPMKYISGHNRRMPIAENIVIDPSSGCHLWVGPTERGYARSYLSGEGKLYRGLWKAKNGPIPKGFHLHHSCQNRACVNLDHLELKSSTEHVRLHHRISEEERKKVAEMRKTMRLADIVAATGYSRWAIWKMAKEYGVTPHDNGARGKRP